VGLAEMQRGPSEITGVRGPLNRETGAGLDYTAVGSSVAACFERAARLHPHRTAVCCRYGDISYAQLNAGANRVAHRLLDSGKVGERVAILMPQDRRIFLAIIAALKAGRIVLVLNRSDPPARIRQLLDDAEPTIILTVDGDLERAQQLAGSK